MLDRPVNPRLPLESIEEAAREIDPVFLRTPQLLAETLGAELGCRLVCKVETLNPIRSFKGRGTDYLVRGLDGAQPLVTASAGNFGQGLAYAARKRGIPLTIFAAETASPLKVARMRDLGAEVRLVGRDVDDAKLAGQGFAAEHGLHFVEDGRDPEIAIGAGTIAVELCAFPGPLEALLVPVGNGALIGGMGRWIKTYSPGTRVVGVCAAGAPAMEQSWRSGAVVTHERVDTIADGIAVRLPVPEALGDMEPVVDEMLLVDDAAIVRAMRLVHEHLGLVVEPAGAVGVAALLGDRSTFRGLTVATVLGGGNLTPDQARRWLLDG